MMIAILLVVYIIIYNGSNKYRSTIELVIVMMMMMMMKMKKQMEQMKQMKMKMPKHGINPIPLVRVSSCHDHTCVV